jgi:hypothetical protein
MRGRTPQTDTEPTDLYGLKGVALLWFPLFGSIGAWTVHILYIASTARLTCTQPGTEWRTHAVTAVTLVVAGVATALGWRLTRTSEAEDAESVGGRHLLLGRLAVIVGLVNILLIGLEELYVIGFHSVRCG